MKLKFYFNWNEYRSKRKLQCEYPRAKLELRWVKYILSRNIYSSGNYASGMQPVNVPSGGNVPIINRDHTIPTAYDQAAHRTNSLIKVFQVILNHSESQMYRNQPFNSHLHLQFLQVHIQVHHHLKIKVFSLPLVFVGDF